jgi:hypothetical protein
VLKANGVEAGAGFPEVSLNCQTPMIGNNLLSVGFPVSSIAIAEMDAVRLPWAVNSNQSEEP